MVRVGASNSPPERSPPFVLTVAIGTQGELAQLGERLVCNQEVTGSSPVFSTSLRRARLTLRLRLAASLGAGKFAVGGARSVATPAEATSGSELPWRAEWGSSGS